MRILLAAFGTRGDLQPMLALGIGQRLAGHEVVYCTPPNFAAWMRGFGFACTPVGMDYEQFILRIGTNLLRALPLLRGQIRAHAETILPLAERSDAVLGSGVFGFTQTSTERYGIPSRYVAFSPSLLPSARHPAPWVSSQRLPPGVNRLSWRVTEAIWAGLFARLYNAERRRLGLPAVGELWPAILGPDVIVAAEPSLAEVPADRRPRTTQPGAFLLPDGEPLSADVEAFLDAGPPPVYIGFGSMGGRSVPRSIRTLVEAARLAGLRAVVSPGWSRLELALCGPDVKVIGAEPHRRLFGRCAAAVHHGGAGTTTAAALAGIPQIVVPQLLDQFYWSHHVRRAGLSPPIARRTRRPGRLAEALGHCVADRALVERCRAFARGMIRDGVARAVTEIESACGSRPSANAPQPPAVSA